MVHKLKPGQTVMPVSPQRSSRNIYLVVQLLPETSYEPQYRVQEVNSGISCIVRESEIRASEPGRNS